MKRTAIYAILFFGFIMLISVACDEDDDTPTQPIDTEFSFRVEVTDSIGNPAANLQVSAWNKLSGPMVQKNMADADSRPRFEGVSAASVQAGETGDINCNSIAYEVADMVMYANYFVQGLDAFTDEQCGIDASDVNPDGNRLAISDLACMVRIVNGDMTPPAQALDTVEGGIITTGLGRINIESDVAVGAVQVKIEGDVTPILIAAEMEMLFQLLGNQTYVLVYSPGGNSFFGDVLEVGTSNVISVKCAAYDGRPMTTTLSSIDVALEQNYPNPFNGVTTFQFAAAVAVDYLIAINDLENSPVETFNGTTQAGVSQIEWDASDCRSGVYPCMLTAYGAGTDTMLYTDTIAAVVHNMDAELDELGYTGTGGVFETTRYLYFPHLYDLPPMISTSPIGNLTGEFGFLDTMIVMLTDTSTSQSQEYEVVVGENANVFNLIWEPIN